MRIREWRDRSDNSEWKNNSLNCCSQGPHASNLGGILAQEIAEQADLRAFIVDPVVVDELSDVARLSGVQN